MSIVQTATDAFKEGLLRGTYDFNSMGFKIALYTGAANLNSSTAFYDPANEVVASGYTAGGEGLILNAFPTITGGIAFVSFENVTWNAALTARAALIYQYDGMLNPSVCVLDFGSDKTSTTTFTVTFPAAINTSAIIRIA